MKGGRYYVSTGDMAGELAYASDQELLRYTAIFEYGSDGAGDAPVHILLPQREMMQTLLEARIFSDDLPRGSTTRS